MPGLRTSYSQDSVFQRYPDDLSSVPRANQAVWLNKPATPLVLDDVFNRRKRLVTSDLQVLLVTANKEERGHMKRDLDGLGYNTTVATSGKSAMEMLGTRGGDFHVVLISVGLTASDSAGEDPDCAGLLAWARDLPSLKEVAMIVLGSYSIDAQHTIELIRCGAMDVFTKPVPVETLHRLRNLVGMTQSLQQQRYTSRGEGGARLVTSYLLRKEREAPDQMGLPLNILDKKSDEGTAASALHDVRVTVLLMQRETRKAHELPQLLRECGFTVGAVARTKNEVMKALGAKNAQYSLLIIEMGQESVPGVGADPRHAEFFSSAQTVLREMSLRQVLLPTIAVQEEKSTDSVVRTMRLGIVDAILPPFTKPKFRALLRYVLKASDQRFLVEESKRMHAQHSSLNSAVGGGGGGNDGTDGASKLSRGGGADGASSKRSPSSHGGGHRSESAVATAAVARIDSMRSSQQQQKQRLALSSRLLDAREVDKQLARAERVMINASEIDTRQTTLTEAAAKKRLQLQKEMEEIEKAEREAQPLDERLVASQEAIDAFQKAADAAKRNARRLAAVLEREQASGGGVGSASREMLEQRVGAANAAAAALQNRLSALEHAHQKKQEALLRGGSRASRKDPSKKTLPPAPDSSLQQPISLLMVPYWEHKSPAANEACDQLSGEVLAGSLTPGGEAGGRGAGLVSTASAPEFMPPVRWRPMTAPLSMPFDPLAAEHGLFIPSVSRSGTPTQGRAMPEQQRKPSAEASSRDTSMRRRQMALGETESAVSRAEGSSERHGTDPRRAGGLGGESTASDKKHSSGGAAVQRIGLNHTIDCNCVQCERRRQLLIWRDSMVQAQERVETERRRFASHGSPSRLKLPVAPKSPSRKNSLLSADS